jgi:FkbM family methyltransferase
MVYLGNERLLAPLAFGGKLVVPTWNLDVALGIIRDGVIEPWTTAAVRTLLQSGQTYVNVGANFGYYTILGAYQVGHQGRVVSVEANPHLIPDILKSTFWSGVPDLIRLHQCAVSDVSGETVRLVFDPQFIGGGSIQDDGVPEGRTGECFWNSDKIAGMKNDRHEIIKWRGYYSGVDVPTETLDDLLSDIDQVDLLQMDIEGSEPAAILGGEKVIRRSPGLSVIMEWSPVYAGRPRDGGRARRMWELLKDEGFHMFRLIPEGVPAGFPRCEGIADFDALMAAPLCELACLRKDAVDRLKLTPA